MQMPPKKSFSTAASCYMNTKWPDLSWTYLKNFAYHSRCYLVPSLASRFHLFVCNRGRPPGLKRKLLDTFLDSPPALVGEESHYGIQGSSAVDDCVGSRLHHGLFVSNPCSAVRGVSRIAQMYYRLYCVLEVAFLERDVTPMFFCNFLDPWACVRLEHLNGCVLIVSAEPSRGLATSACFLNCPFFFQECAIHRCLRTGWIASSLMYQVSTRKLLLFSFLVDAWVITFTSDMPFNKVYVTLRWRDVSVWNERQSPISHRDLIWRHVTLQVDHEDHDNKSLLRFGALWEADYNHDSLLVYSTGRSPSMYFDLRQEVPLLTPGIAIMSVGTEIVYGDTMTPDLGWKKILSAGWDRSAVEAVANEMNLKYQVWIYLNPWLSTCHFYECMQLHTFDSLSVEIC